MTEQEITQAEKEAFEKEYNEMILKHGLTITYVPQMKLMQDTGVWALVIIPILSRFEPPK